jgi:hypothetical protein
MKYRHSFQDIYRDFRDFQDSIDQNSLRDKINKEHIKKYLEERKKTEKRCRGCLSIFIGPSGVDSCIDCQRYKYKEKYGEEYVKKNV